MQYSATIKMIRRVELEETNVYITIDQNIIVMKGGEETESDQFSIKLSQFTAQLCNIDENIALYRAMSERSFSQKELALLFVGAQIAFERTRITEGEEIEDGKVATFNGFITRILGVKLTKRATQLLENSFAL